MLNVSMGFCNRLLHPVLMIMFAHYVQLPSHVHPFPVTVINPPDRPGG